MMNRLFFVLILGAAVSLTTSCEKNRIENNCCTDEYRIVTTRYETPDSFNLYIAQAFTPNNDGVNDYFTARGRGYEIESMIIRDGRQEVFNLKDHLEPFWDGRDVKDGSYDYTFELRLSNSELIEVEGSVCVLKPGAVSDRNYDLKREKICDCLMGDMIDDREGAVKAPAECPEGSAYGQDNDE